MDDHRISVYRKMMQTPPSVDQDYLRSILHVSDAQIIEHIDITKVIESNTALIIKLCVRIQDIQGMYSKKLFIKTIKTDESQNAYHHMSIKEAGFYALVNDTKGIQLPIPTCYDVFVSEGTGEFVIVLEDVSDQYKPPEHKHLTDQNIWLSCAQNLAKLHAAFWNLQGLEIDKLTVVSEQQLQENMKDDREHVEKFLEYAGARFTEQTKSIFRKALEINHKRLVDERQRILSQDNVTIVNGDCHIYNFMIPIQKNEKPIIVDFQFWGKGYGTGDLAHLTRVGFPDEFRKTLHKPVVEQYYESLLAHGVTGYSWDNCYNDYRMSVASMVLIPVWQYAFFDLKYDDWADDIDALIDNYTSLACDTL